MGGGHNSHAAGISKRRGPESQAGSRASKYISCDNFATVSETYALKTDITTYTNSVTPSKNDVIKVRIALHCGVLHIISACLDARARALAPVSRCWGEVGCVRA